MINDPHDEWPKLVVLRLAGLQPCGCPIEPSLCKCVTDYHYDGNQRSTLGGPTRYNFETPGPLCGAKVDRAPGAE